MFKTLDGYINHIYREYVRNSRDRGFAFNLSIEEYKTLIFKNCFYCDSAPKYRSKGVIPVNGVDRIDSSKNYSLENCVTACTTCNKMKSNLLMSEFLDKIVRIYKKKFRN